MYGLPWLIAVILGGIAFQERRKETRILALVGIVVAILPAPLFYLMALAYTSH
jgi:hypothetical protein